MTDLIKIASFNTRVQADLARLYLESHGIGATVFDGTASQYIEGTLTGVQVMVLEEEFLEAEKLLRNYKP